MALCRAPGRYRAGLGGDREAHAKTGKLYTEMVYQPMLEPASFNLDEVMRKLAPNN